ncbi:hypothetical protein C6Y62_02825 [Hyphomicrobium sulfonivorans]|nr:hypothetical protein [Hyphomicrobium sulfonivorans]
MGEQPVTQLLSIGWAAQTSAQAGRRTPDRRLIDMMAAIAAGVLITGQTAAGIFEQAQLDGEQSATEISNGDGTAQHIGRETMLGAYSGAPYTYPSPVRIEIPSEQPTDFTIDKVDWFTLPFKSPIYYGARVTQWFTGGIAGGGVDFIHSKALAPLNDEASFSGTLNGEELPARTRIGDIVSKLEFSHGHNMLLLTGFVRLPSIGPRISPYVGLGGGALLPHTEFELAQNPRPRTYEYNYAGPAGQALFGFEFRLSKVSFFLEYKFTFADYEAPLSEEEGSWLPLDLWRQAQRWLAGQQPAGGHITTQVVSHQVVGGLQVRIAPVR